MFPWDVLAWKVKGLFRLTPTSVSDGESPDLLTDALGRLRVIVDSTSGATPYSVYAPTGLVSRGAIKASAGSLRQVLVTNMHTAPVWLTIYNKATVPSSPEEQAALLKIIVRIPAEESLSMPLVGDMAFSSGIFFIGFTDTEFETEVAEKLKIVAFYL